MALGYYCKSCGVFDEKGVANHKCIPNAIPNIPNVCTTNEVSQKAVEPVASCASRKKPSGSASQKPSEKYTAKVVSESSVAKLPHERTREWRSANKARHNEYMKDYMRKKRAGLQEV